MGSEFSSLHPCFKIGSGHLSVHFAKCMDLSEAIFLLLQTAIIVGTRNALV